MNEVKDFVHAALPWIAMGLLLAIFFARNASVKKQEKPKKDYGTEGMSLGMYFGVAIGSSIPSGTGIGMILGMLAGLGIGCRIEKKE